MTAINWTKIAATVKTIAGDIEQVAPLAAVAGPEGAARRSGAPGAADRGDHQSHSH